MKSFLKIAVFLSFSALVSSQCTSTAANECGNEASDCFNNGSTQDQICACVGSYGACLNAVSCYVNATSFCLQSGCTLQQCSGTPQNNSCSAASATACANDVTTCVTNAGSDLDAICVCYGGYAGCLTDAGCDASSVITACESAGCASQLCSGNSTQNNTCSAASATSCSSDFSTCYNNAGSNFDALCACYGGLAGCLTDAGCDASSVTDACESAGCTAQQCGGNSPPNDCDAAAASSCANDVATCINNAGSDLDAICACYGGYAVCLTVAGCDASSVITACESAGCASQLCSGNSTQNNTCSTASATLCANDLATCYNNAGSNYDALCACIGEYIGCITDAGCDASSAIDACESAGCSAQVCNGESPQNNTCSTSAASACATEASDCFSSAGSNQNLTCECYGDFAACFDDAGCPDSSIISACLSNGCTAQQCGGNSPPNDCDASAASSCANDVTTCINNAGSDFDAICECYGLYVGCLTDAGCDASSVVTGCEAAGCPAQVCDGVSPPPQNNTCSSSAVTTCSNEFTDCFNSATTPDQSCACYGTYFVCLNDVGCSVNATESCYYVGCTLQQCFGESPQNNTCDSSAASACAGEVVDCITNAGSNTDSICECYGEFATCLTDAGLDASSVISNCDAAGCSADQCEGAANCDADAAINCGEQVFACLDSNSNSNCDCFGSYIVCLDDAGCDTASAEASCSAEGCSASECDGPFGQIHKQVMLDTIASFHLDRE